MINAILFVSVFTLVMTLRTAWVVQDTKWNLDALYEKVDRMDYDVRSLIGSGDQ